MSSSMRTLREEFALLQDVRYDNEVRVERAREVIGFLYFFLALAMVIYCLLIASLQAWLLPTRRLQRYLPLGSRTEAGTVYHAIVLTVFYFAISLAGGLSGYLIMTFLYLVAFISMLVFALLHRHRKLSKKRSTFRDTSPGGGGERSHAAEFSDSEDDDNGNDGAVHDSRIAALKEGNDEKWNSVAVTTDRGGSNSLGRSRTHDTSVVIPHEPPVAEHFNLMNAGMFPGAVAVEPSPQPAASRGGSRRSTHKRKPLEGSSPSNANGDRDSPAGEDEKEKEAENTDRRNRASGENNPEEEEEEGGAAAGGTNSSGALQRVHSIGLDQNRHNNVSAGESRGDGSRSSGSANGGGVEKKPVGMKVVDSDDMATTTWTTHPRPITNSQLRLALVAWILLIVIFIVMCGLLFGDRVRDYTIVAEEDGNGYLKTQNITTSLVEYQPPLTAKALVLMYAFPRVATFLKLQLYVQWITEYCGKTFTKHISSDKEKRSKIYKDWIQKYDINMSWYQRTEYVNYSSVNDWFTRAIRLNLRPIPPPRGGNWINVLSPADCRMLVYETVQRSVVWVKDAIVSAKALTGGIEGDYWSSGTMVIARLAPQDYHRFHAPVAGNITSITELGTTYWSVSADAARSENFAFLNKRKVVVIDGGLSIGKVAYVAIGATCVGSVPLEHSDGTPIAEGDFVSAGDQLGKMQFGGSTVIMLFGRGRVILDPKLLQRSKFPVESYILARSAIGHYGT